MSTDADSASLVEQWRGVAVCHAKVSGALDKALEREHGIGLSEFEVLERLATTEGGDGRRMQDLAEAVCLSQSALSRLIGRLETAGLVQRAMCANDRRGIYAHITPEGRAAWEKAAPTHRAVLAEQLPANAPGAAAAAAAPAAT
ncbi:MarR family winged helix-turn-helix transcriptional regulator [Conexibacter woesei]|uniref:MarR family winged helix-turn-helix transcriptional regulator n=1 Tax=Conexibacter woesei TaxID=191495 RepID=UPI00068882E3|nr:MarR family transcriptional regulator [Conexibacter woesei]